MTEELYSGEKFTDEESAFLRHVRFGELPPVPPPRTSPPKPSPKPTPAATPHRPAPSTLSSTPPCRDLATLAAAILRRARRRRVSGRGRCGSAAPARR